MISTIRHCVYCWINANIRVCLGFICGDAIEYSIDNLGSLWGTSTACNAFSCCLADIIGAFGWLLIAFNLETGIVSWHIASDTIWWAWNTFWVIRRQAKTRITLQASPYSIEELWISECSVIFPANHLLVDRDITYWIILIFQSLCSVESIHLWVNQ